MGRQQHLEDDAVLVLNKPANMVVHPGVGNYTGTLFFVHLLVLA